MLEMKGQKRAKYSFPVLFLVILVTAGRYLSVRAGHAPAEG